MTSVVQDPQAAALAALLNAEAHGLAHEALKALPAAAARPDLLVVRGAELGLVDERAALYALSTGVARKRGPLVRLAYRRGWVQLLETLVAGQPRISFRGCTSTDRPGAVMEWCVRTQARRKPIRAVMEQALAAAPQTAEDVRAVAAYVEAGYLFADDARVTDAVFRAGQPLVLLLARKRGGTELVEACRRQYPELVPEVQAAIERRRGIAWALGYNVLRIMSGLGGLAFSQ